MLDSLIAFMEKEIEFSWRMDAFWQTQNTSVLEVSVYWDPINKNILRKQKSGPENKRNRRKKKGTETQHTELVLYNKEKETDQCKKLKLRNLAESSWKINEGTQEGNEILLAATWAVD